MRCSNADVTEVRCAKTYIKVSGIEVKCDAIIVMDVKVDKTDVTEVMCGTVDGTDMRCDNIDFIKDDK